MRRIVLYRSTDGEAENGPWRRPALPVHASLAARLVPWVIVRRRGPTLGDLLAVGERVRGKHQLASLARLDLGRVGLRVPDATVVGRAVVQMLILKEPGDAFALVVVVVIIGISGLEYRGAVVAAREYVADVEACEADGDRARG